MTEKQDIPSLTGLRGIAAMAVMIYHAAFHIYGPAPTASGLSLMPYRGYLAVDLFFMLSGFVLAHVYGCQFATGLRGYGRFIWARFARIYPVHFFVLCLMLPFLGTGEMFSPRSLAFNLVLLQGPWLSTETWNAPSWSISAEWHAYLIFPLLALALSRARPFGIVLLSTLCVGLLLQLARANAGDLQPVIHGPFSLARSLPEFTIGVLAYRCYQSGYCLRLFRSDLTFVVIGAGILALCGIASSDFVIIALLPALLFAASVNAGRVRSVLNGRAIGFLGEISYALYMVHYFCIVGVIGAVRWFGGTPSGVAVFTTSLCVSVGLATLASRCIEYPARALLRNIPPVRLITAENYGTRRLQSGTYRRSSD